MVDGIIFYNLISLATHTKLEMHIMDVVTTYLYGSINNDNYMEVQEWIRVPEAQTSNSR